MVSKALVAGIYQRKLEDIAALGIDLTAAVPPSWRDERGEQLLERVYTDGYRLEILPLRLNGSFHLHTYGRLGRLMRDVRPDLVHIDEEPYNVAAWQMYWHAKRIGARTVLFSWQNIARRYPPPFSWGERRLMGGIDALIAGQSRRRRWREKGYTGKVAVFRNSAPIRRCSGLPVRPSRPFTIGYFGRLIEEKGVTLLLDPLRR